MTIRTITLALLASTALVAAPAAAHKTGKKHHHHGKMSHSHGKGRVAAGGPNMRAQLAAQQAKIDELSARLNAMQTGAPTAVVVDTAAADEAAANTEFLKAQVDALQAQLETVKKQTAENAPSFRAAPLLSNSAGFNFKVRGRLHYDTGYVSNPDNRVATKNLGFGTRVRRARLGVQGALTGGFTYTSEFDFAGNSVAFTDVILEYNAKGSPFTITAGHHYPMLGLEQITSSNFISFHERAQFVEAYGYGRRLGGSVTFAKGDFRIAAGLFGDTVNATGNVGQDSWQGSARVTYSPEVLGGRLHLGANYQYRKFQSNTENFQYRVRPGSQITDIRFIDTGSIAADGDQIIGLEAAFIAGPLHIAAEGAYNEVDSFRPGTIFNNGDSAAGGTLLARDPNFFGVYGEVGYYLTGETRGYARGRFDRTKVLNGFDKGGPGAIQINGRVDYMDLESRVAATGTTGQQIIGGILNGGKQFLYSANVIWNPVDYVRFSLQYTHSEVEGGPRAAAIRPFATGTLATDRKYGVEFIGLRTQFDF